MKSDHRIVKTETPEELEPCKIVSRPAGDCPYYLICVPQKVVDDNSLEDDIIDDTSEFFSDYDLSEEEDDLGAV